MVESPFKYFDAIYCINLPHRTDRRILASEEFLKIGILEKVIFFPGITVEDNGHLGCFLSHISILKEAAMRNYKNVLVFEDDVEFLSFDTREMQGYINALGLKKWDIFYFGCSFFPEDLPYLQREHKNIYRVFGGRSTHSIAYNQSFYSAFLAELDDYNIENLIKKYNAFDAYFSKFIQQKKVAYIPSRVLCKQRESFSDNEGKVINLDRQILKYFLLLKEQNGFLFFFKKNIRILYYFIWRISGEKLDLFYIFSNIYSLFKINFYRDEKK